MSVRSLDWRSSTVGIIGLGNIGVQVAQMCTALGMKVIYTGRSAKPDVSFEFVSLEKLLGRSDCVVLTCLLSKETEGLMNAERFGMMKQNSVLVNVCELPRLGRGDQGRQLMSARGQVVEEQALVDALKSGRGELPKADQGSKANISHASCIGCF